MEEPMMDLLELIPNLSPEIMVFHPAHRIKAKPKPHIDLPTYKLRREPNNLNDFNGKEFGTKSAIAIWRDNGTLTWISNSYSSSPYQGRNFCFTFRNVGTNYLKFIVYGTRAAAIVETCVYFWSLEHPKQYKEPCLQILSSDSRDAFKPEQLARMLDSNPKRCVEFSKIVMSGTQSVVLATRPYPVNLKFEDSFSFADQGTAFVAALENRTSFLFGSLIFNVHRGVQVLNYASMKRFFELATFKKLTFINFLHKECALLPFSAKANTLYYQIDMDKIKAEDFESLEIIAKDLHLEFHHQLDSLRGWDNIMVSFLNRVAELGQFERLCFGVLDEDGNGHSSQFKFSEVAAVARALVVAINENQKLSYLDLSETEFNWTPHLKNVLEAMEEHQDMRTLIIQKYPVKAYSLEEETDEDGMDRDYYDSDDEDVNENDQEEREVERVVVDPDTLYDPDYSWLKQLLYRNRNITVLDGAGNVCSDGSSINQLYLLNHVYCGSLALIKDSPDLRRLLVATALVENAAESFQRSALLLEYNTDVLCELIQALNLEELLGSEAATEETALPISETNDQAKRTMSIQLPRVVKRRRET